MREQYDSNFNLINDPDNEKKPLKFDINQENIEEKENLKKVLKKIENKLSEDLEKEKNKNEVEEQEITQRKKSNILSAFKWQRHNKKYRWLLFLIFNVFLPVLIIINLIGIFQIISVMSAISEVIKRSIWCYLDLEDKEDKEYYEFDHFYGFYYKFSLDEGIDFDLIETMSFLGTIFVKFYGFTVSSGFFMLLNVISLLLIVNFFSEYNENFEKYSILQMIYLIICYLLLFVGVGSSALLSQQLLIDRYEKYSLFLEEQEEEEKQEDKNEEEKKQKDKNEEEKSKDPYFILVCVTSIIGFLFKYFFNIIITYYKNKFDEKYERNDNDIISTDSDITNTKIKMEIYNHDKNLFWSIFGIYAGSITISIGLYRLFKLFLEDDSNDEEKNEEKKGKKECYFLGYIIYMKQYDNKNFTAEDDINKNMKKEIKNSMDNSINDIDDIEKNIGVISTTEIIGAVGKTNTYSGEKKNMFQRACNRIKKFCIYLFVCFRLLSDSFVKCFNEIICNYFCCGNNCCCCCICFECCNCCECRECCECCCCGKMKKIKEEDYDLNDGYFCYCYKAKRNIKWFNRFIRDETQVKIMPLLVQYFLIQLNAIAFDKIFEENNEEGTNKFNDLSSILYFILVFGGSLFLFFYFTISFGNLIEFFNKGTKQENQEKKEEKIGELNILQIEEKNE